jgi:hypothetical protein
MPDVNLDADGLAGLIVDEINLGQFTNTGWPLRISYFTLPLLPTTY